MEASETGQLSPGGDVPPEGLRADIAAVPPPERWADSSVLVAFAFRCNLACTFCMVEDVLQAYDGTTLEAFRRFAERDGALRGVRRIVFSGGEVTLAKDLTEYIKLARSLPGIEHVRLQTNGTRLADRAYLSGLIAAGADEYFISLHGHDAATCDAVTQRKGSFDEILAGMRSVNEAGAALFTNTAITAQSVASLAAIVETVAPFAPRSMEFWNYWPRADEIGDRGHFVRVAEARAPLLRALAACVERGVPPAVKWFPRCLLGEYDVYHDDGQPPSLIELSPRPPPPSSSPEPRAPLAAPDYFEREPSYACIYEGVCEDAAELAVKGTPASGRCAGLSEPYIHRFGWEADVLSPRRKVPVSPSDVTRSLVRDAGPKRTEAATMATWLDRFGLSVGRSVAGWSLVSAVRSRDGAMVSLAFQSGPRSAVVRLCPRDEARRAPLRTASFDVFYTVKDPGPKEPVAALVRGVASAIQAADMGGLALPT